MLTAEVPEGSETREPPVIPWGPLTSPEQKWGPFREMEEETGGAGVLGTREVSEQRL